MSKITKTNIVESVVFCLGILAILTLAFIAFMPHEANAASTRAYQEPDRSFDYDDYNYDNSDDSYSDYNDYDNDNIEVPAITSISPNSFNAGGDARTITVRGHNFNPDSKVRWNGFNRPTSYRSSTRLEVDLRQNDVFSSGSYPITVYNENGGVSNTAYLTVNRVANAPVYSPSQTRTSTTPVVTDESSELEMYRNMEVSDLASNAFFGGNSFMPSGLIQWLFIAIFILLAVIAWRSISGKDKYNATPMKHA